jgi:hypothetical protein
MSRIEFHIHSPDGDQWQRLKDHLPEPKGGLDWTPVRSALARVPLGRALLRLPVSVTAGVGVVVLAAWSGVFEPTQIHGVSIRGTHILILVDATSSMSEDGIPDELKRQMASLKASVLAVADTFAFGVSSVGYHDYRGYASNLLYSLSRQLSAHPEVDSVYVVSDFHPEEAGADCDNRAGLVQFQELIKKSRVRLYLSSVYMLPSPGLLAIAEESGGGLIATLAKSSAAARLEFCGAIQ